MKLCLSSMSCETLALRVLKCDIIYGRSVTWSTLFDLDQRSDVVERLFENLNWNVAR